MKWWLEVASAISALGAGVLWTCASFQKVEYVERRDEQGLIPATITEINGDKRVDVLRTVERQTKWNGLAASAASAFSQALSLFLGN
jgi:hypothetical protein